MKTTSVYICIILVLFCLSFSECKRKNTILEFQETFSNVDNIYLPVDMDSPTGADIYVTSVFGQVFKFANNDEVLQSAVSVWFNIYEATGINFFSNADIGGDEGLTSIEFHPSYPTVRKFYAFYTSSATAIQITAFSVFTNGTVNYDSADVLFTIPKPAAKEIEQPYGILYEAYLGGDLRFHCEDQEGDDDDDCGGQEDNNGCNANLYIATGYGNDDTAAQNNTNLLGKILRVIPSKTSTGYSIPPSNPRISTFGPAGVVYARGLRNPRKMYFAEDPANLFVGDVGDIYDEINVIRKAKNYGWNVVEGCTSNGLFANPIYSYTDSNAHAITQGPYYDGHGGGFKAIRERMLFADLYSGQLYAIQSSAVGSSCGATPFAVAKVENALVSSILVVDNDVFVCNVIGAAYGLPTFYKLVEVEV